MIDLRNSLTIEATDDPTFFSFYSDELEGFTGTGSSVEDCLDKARSGMIEFVEYLAELGYPIPLPNPNPQVLIHNTAPAINA